MKPDHDFPLPALDQAAQDRLSRLSQTASTLGREIVDIAGFLDRLECDSQAQLKALGAVKDGSARVATANTAVLSTVDMVAKSAQETLKSVSDSTEYVGQTSNLAIDLAQWVQQINDHSAEVREMLEEVKTSNEQIATIAAQVNMLAINAKIEAARAGDAGKGFAVVADAINELSQSTSKAANDITGTVGNLSNWVQRLSEGASQSAIKADTLLERGDATDRALTTIKDQVAASQTQTEVIRDEAGRADEAVQSFTPSIASIDASFKSSAEGVKTAHTRVEKLIDRSERMVQDSVAMGGSSDDGPMILHVQDIAGQISQALTKAVESRRISLSDLFDENYRPIEGSDPVQYTTRFLRLTDQLLPALQEPATKIDSRVVFCAAVDRNGYLPTHNKKFSQPPSTDPEWNMANCRNRRIFDDRVGLKAGRNTQPFLLQVYRRDMGGGNFVMMKDLSAPITINGRHWGGLRLAYKF